MKPGPARLCGALNRRTTLTCQLPRGHVGDHAVLFRRLRSTYLVHFFWRNPWAVPRAADGYSCVGSEDSAAR